MNTAPGAYTQSVANFGGLVGRLRPRLQTLGVADSNKHISLQHHDTIFAAKKCYSTDPTVVSNIGTS